MIAYLQRLAGLALLCKTPEHVFPFFCGKGANGKTVIANVLQGLMFAQSRRLAAHYLDRRINFPAICLGTLGQVAAADIRI